MELRNRKRIRCDHSTYIPTATRDDGDDDDGECEYAKNLYAAIGVYVLFFGVVGLAVMGCNQKYTNNLNLNPKPKPTPFVSIIPIMNEPTTVKSIVYTMKNHTHANQQQHLHLQQLQKQQPEVKTRIYSVFIQTSNYSSSIEFHRNRHTILKDFIHNTNYKNNLNWIQVTLQKHNSYFIRMNEYSQSNIFSPNTYNLLASNTFLSANRPTEFIDITIVSGNQKINASQSIITVYR
jgi:hypothetical protein